MKQLNTRRSALLKTEKIAVLNEGGTVEELMEILKYVFPKDIDANGSATFYIKLSSVTWRESTILPDGYTAHPISWFYEADEAVKPTFDELKAMSLEERIEALKKKGYVDGAKYNCAHDGEICIIDSTSDNTFGTLGDEDDIYSSNGEGYLYEKGKWAEIISKPDEAPQPEKLPEYVKVVKLGTQPYWYDVEIGEVFKVTGKDKDYFEVSYKDKYGLLIYKSDCIPCDANGNPIGEQPEAEIIGWELMIDVPEVELKAGDKAFEIYKTVVTFPNRSSIFKSVIRQIGIPIYKRTTTYILNAVKDGTMSVEDAVKELEQTKTV